MTTAVERYKTLSSEELDIIITKTDNLYFQVLKQADCLSRFRTFYMTNQHLQKDIKKSKLSKKLLNLLITRANRRKLRRYRKDRARTRMIRAITGGQESHLDDILRNVLKHLTPVTQPPVLISQIHHAGFAKPAI